MQPIRVITIGEILLRLSPDWNQNTAAIYVGGAEANVAGALAQWGTPVAYVSKVPDNGLSTQVVAQLSRLGIATDRILRGGDRIGAYYLAQGSDLKHAEVVYDRKYSAFSEIQPGTVDWEQLLAGAEWLHWSAISPALGALPAAICLEVLEAATRLNMTISTDLNYRSKLWQYGKHPSEVMPALAAYCDVIMGNIWSAQQMLHTALDTAALENPSSEVCLQQAALVAAEITQTYTRCKRVAFTFRFSDGPSHNRYYAVYYHNGQQYVSRTYETNEVVDRVGSGDCFMAGLIHAQLNGDTEQQIIDFAAAAAYSKFFVQGDMNTTAKAAILKLI